MARMRQFTLRTASLLFVSCALVFTFYANMRFESKSQQKSIDLLTSRNAECGKFQDRQHDRFGYLFGFTYPADQVMFVKGPERGDWGVVPGWISTDQDLELLQKFRNLQEVYLRNSTYSDAGLKALAKLPKVTHIEFRFCNLKNADLSILATNPNLNSLNLYACDLPPNAPETIHQSLPDCDIHGIGG